MKLSQRVFEKKEIPSTYVLTHKQQIFPLLLNKRSVSNNLVLSPLNDSLQLAYVFNQGISFTLIDKKLQQEMDMNLATLNQLAQENFLNYFDKPLVVLDKKRGILGYQYLDFYDATRVILVLKKFGGLENLLGEDLLIMIPHRDLLMLFSNSNYHLYNRIRMYGQSHFINHPEPVSNQVFQLKNGELVNYLD